jgi:hypothetical protein
MIGIQLTHSGSDDSLVTRLKTFEPHKHWQTHEFKVALMPKRRLSMQSGYSLRLYGEGFELVPTGEVFGLASAVATALDRLARSRWVLHYSDIRYGTVDSSRRLELHLSVGTTEQRVVLVAPEADSIADALEANGVRILRPGGSN